MEVENMQGISRDMEAITESNENVGNRKHNITNKGLNWWPYGRLDSAKERISKLTDRAIENFQTETKIKMNEWKEQNKEFEIYEIYQISNILLYV